jgi:hypothetical protein
MVREFGLRAAKALVYAALIEGDLDWLGDTLGEDDIAPIREALRVAVARYVAQHAATASARSNDEPEGN